MRIIARHTLASFMEKPPETKPSVERWHTLAKASAWKTSAEVQSGFPKAEVLSGERVRFEIAGGNDRMIVAFDFPRQIAFIKFVGTHAEYDGIDALSVSVS